MILILIRIIALLLGRLGLTVRQAMEEYRTLFEAIFPAVLEPPSVATNTTRFEEALKKILEKYGLSADTRMIDVDERGKGCHT